MEHKVLAIIVVTIMVLSGLAVLGGTVAAQPSPGGHTATALATSSSPGQSSHVLSTPTPNIAFSPNVLTATQVDGQTTITPSVYNVVLVSTTSISDSSSSNIYFYWATGPYTKDISTGASFEFVPYAGETSMPAGTIITPTSTSGPSVSPGQTVYLIASFDSSSPTSAVGFAQFTISPLTPTLLLSSSLTGTPASSASIASGATVYVSGGGYSPTTSSVPIYFNYDGSSIMLGTAKAVAGTIAPQPFTVPINLPAVYHSSAHSLGHYALVAVDSTGVTAVAALEITPSITLSQSVLQAGAKNTITVSGTGFAANQYIQANSITAAGSAGTNSLVTVSSSGSFSVSFTTPKLSSFSPTLSNDIVSVSVTESYSSSVSSTGITGASSILTSAYVSSPTYNEMGVGVTKGASSSDLVHSGATHTYVALGLPASTTFELMVGPDSVLSFTSDAYGGAVGTFTVPTNLPAGTYSMTVANPTYGLSAQIMVSLTIEGSATSSMVSSGYSFLPPGYLAGETGSGSFVIAGTGFPSDASISVTALSPPGASIGDFSIASPAMTSLNGSFNYTVTVSSDNGFSTGVTTTLYLSVGGASATLSDVFTQYVSPLVGSFSSQIGASSTSTVPDNVSLLIGSSSQALLSGGSYTLMFGTMAIVTFVPSSSGVSVTSELPGTAVSGTTSGVTVHFLIPTVSSGQYPINLELDTKEIGQTSYIGSFFLVTNSGGTPTVEIQDVNALEAAAIGTNYIASSSGAGVGMAQGAVSSATDSVPDSAYVFAFGYPTISSPTGSDYTLFSAGSLISQMTATSGDYSANGAWFSFVGLNVVQGGKYLIDVNDTFTQASLSNAAYFTVSAAFSSLSYSGNIGSTVSFSVSGLMPNTNYVLEVNGTVLMSSGAPVTYLSLGDGAVSGSFVIPTLPVSQSVGFTDYPLAIALASNPSSVVASSVLSVTFPNTTTLSPGYAAFPTEPVSFSWLLASGTYSGSTPMNPSTPGAGPIQVTVYLDGSPITTVQAMYSTGPTLSGTFAMPNGVAGTVYNISFSYSQSVAYSSGSSYTPYGSTEYLSASSIYGAPIVLSTGAGAFVVSISTSTLVATIQTAIGNAMKVPLAQLNASIKAINGTAVLISTKFGEMNTTLGIMNASISQILQNSLVLTTDLGHVQVTLSQIDAQLVSFNSSLAVINTTAGQLKVDIANLNASLAAFNGNIISIKTSIGTMSGTLASINGTVASNAAGISTLVGSTATISTNLGTISGTVTSISNGQATIQTKLGNLTTAVGNIQTKTSSVSSSLSNTLIFEIVILVLVVITLALVAVVIMRGRKQSPPKEYKEEPKQPKQ
ncbi:MAG: hypothetical protein LVQ96_03190 [Thermoplasmatales archaeon]|nr:hypothetical protein [Thermoplasmatales archaeon]MCW6170154.1 hypothetical protein [Thermoplasmatales archaeon]